MSDDYINIMPHILSSSIFPPSFDGNPWIFTAALFSTLAAALISIVQIYALMFEIKKIPDKWSNPINTYRFQMILAYVTILTAVGPDAVYLWTYQEVTAKTTNIILNVDRIMDSAMLIPFAMFTYLYLRCGSVLKFQLLRRAIPVDIKPSKSAVKTYIACAVTILLMSVGVALSK